jgi:hypothetical protein
MSLRRWALHNVRYMCSPPPCRKAEERLVAEGLPASDWPVVKQDCIKCCYQAAVQQ